MASSSSSYRGRLAPSPTGYLHLGHARTFWTAQQRARSAGGALVLRDEDLDPARVRADFAAAMLEDLRWFGLIWQEGPDVGGPFGPYNQSQRRDHYLSAFEQLRAASAIYPCTCSRRDVQEAAGAPHEAPPGEAWTPDEPIYPGTCRPENSKPGAPARRSLGEGRANWRFRVPDGATLTFTDGHYGAQSATAGVHFGDFLVWRKDDTPAYQLACVVDDAAMRISEIVRGADLLLSTFRQLLLYRALRLTPPSFYHCPLLTDEQGVRLAKRHDALSLRTLRAQGRSPENIRAAWY
ncbi:MAG: tRNA glutamyl-Q(34) synthetase GluQRS [Opitutaceae bacterium]